MVENVIYKVIINSANEIKNVSDQQVAHSKIHGIATTVTSKLIRKIITTIKIHMETLEQINFKLDRKITYHIGKI